MYLSHACNFIWKKKKKKACLKAEAMITEIGSSLSKLVIIILKILSKNFIVQKQLSAIISRPVM